MLGIDIISGASLARRMLNRFSYRSLLSIVQKRRPRIATKPPCAISLFGSLGAAFHPRTATARVGEGMVVSIEHRDVVIDLNQSAPWPIC